MYHTSGVATFLAVSITASSNLELNFIPNGRLIATWTAEIAFSSCLLNHLGKLMRGMTTTPIFYLNIYRIIDKKVE